jgi:hypothetical protein
MIKAQAVPTPTPTSSDLGKRTKQQAAHAISQCKTAGPEVLVVETQPSHTKHADSTPSTPLSQSPLEGIADLLENLSTEACVELTHHLLSTASSLPTEEAHPRPVLKAIILFIAKYGSVAYGDKQGKSIVADFLEHWRGLQQEAGTGPVPQ